MIPARIFDWTYILAALKGKWSGDSNYFVSDHTAVFYRLKAVLCLLLNLEPRSKWARDNFLREHVIVTYTNGGSYYAPGEPTQHWFEAIAVGHGILSNWWATIYQDSN
jgi:hypothetical protein